MRAVRRLLSKVVPPVGGKVVESATTQPATTPEPKQTSPQGWMQGAAWASLGSEFKSVPDDKYLKPSPEGFLTPRAHTDVQPAEELMNNYLEKLAETYKGLDVRDPTTLQDYDGNKPGMGMVTLGAQVRAVGEFISGHLAHHVAIPEWKNLFDLQHIEMDLTYWLYILHAHMICRRATSIPITTFSRRRETLEEIIFTMFDSWIHTSEDVMGRPPLGKIRNYIKDMYYVTAANLEEALLHDGPGADLMLLGILVKFCPLPRPEDVPMYTYYTLVHYIRFHTALFDRMPDEQFSIGNFNFIPPNDPAIFAPYSDVKFDEIIRGWVKEDSDDSSSE